MKRFKVNISYLFLLIKKHPLYISVYGFFELYNTAFISFKNVYLYVILLRMIANSLSIKKILAFLIISAIVSAAMLFLSALFHEIIEPKTRCLIEKEFDEEIFKKLSSVDVSCFDDDKFYNDVIISTSSVANYIINNFIQTVNFIKSVFSIFTLLPLLMAVNSIWILFVIAGVIFVNFLLNKKTEKIKYEENQSLIPHTRKINYINKIFISKDSACDVHTHYSADFVLNIMNDVTEKKIKIKKNFCFKKFLLSLADQLLCHMFFIEYLYSIYLIIEIAAGKIMFSDFLGAKNTLNIIYGGFTNITKSLMSLSTISIYLERYNSFIKKKNSLKSGQIVPDKAFQKLSFENVDFSYDLKSTKKVLDNINISINPHEKVAIVGGNGAGKSTFIKLILHFYDVNNGKVMFNEVDIQNYKEADYRNNFSVAFQECNVYKTLLKYNVSANICTDEEHIKSIFESVGLNKFNNYINNELSKEFSSNGIDLSGGERQRLIIARAIYQDKQIIILDEPSAALDCISEYQLNKLLDELAKKHTVIIISHRLYSVKTADQIIVLENGKVIENGTHAELLENNRVYAAMYRKQHDAFE